jgi:hypothetical protein
VGTTAGIGWWVTEEMRVGEEPRGSVSGSYRARRGRTSAIELAGSGRQWCTRVGEGRHVGEERCVGVGSLVGEGCIGDRCGEERRRRRWRQ